MFINNEKDLNIERTIYYLLVYWKIGFSDYYAY